MRKISKFCVAACLVAVGAHASAAGVIVVCGDEWSMSDAAFSQNGAFTNQYVLNVANLMMGGSGSVRMASGNGIAFGSQWNTVMNGNGYTVTSDTNPITLAGMVGYDAVYLAGGNGSANLADIATYLNGGGNVYLAGGTGEFGTDTAEAAAWNPLLNLYGINMGSAWINPPSAVDVTTDAGTHPLRAGVDKLTFGFGHDMTAFGGSVVALSGGPELSANIGLVATNAVPEPATMVALGVGLAAIVRRRRRS